MTRLYQAMRQCTQPIDEMTVYLNQVYATKRFSFGTWTSRQHIFLSVKAGGQAGYGENIITVNQPEVSLNQWCEWLRQLKGRPVGEAFLYLREHLDSWQDRMTEMTEMCLIDLAGKLVGERANALLGLSGAAPVNGAFVILSDDVAFVEQQAQWAKRNHRAQVMKVKLFGDTDVDEAVIGAVRRHCPQESTYLLGDVNCGYRTHGQTVSVEQIAEQLCRLHGAGLNACEDPAFLEIQEWVHLQKLVQPLALIPDYPLRPSRVSVNTIVKGMGSVYNIHPGSAGSVVDAVALARKIRELGAELMIGDDSLIGPGCSIWQQLGVGLGASWIEATEKQGESDAYYQAVCSLPTDSRQNPIVPNNACAGFGIILNEEALRQAADRVYQIA